MSIIEALVGTVLVALMVSFIVSIARSVQRGQSQVDLSSAAGVHYQNVVRALSFPSIPVPLRNTSGGVAKYRGSTAVSAANRLKSIQVGAMMVASQGLVVGGLRLQNLALVHLSGPSGVGTGTLHYKARLDMDWVTADTLSRPVGATLPGLIVNVWTDETTHDIVSTLDQGPTLPLELFSARAGSTISGVVPAGTRYVEVVYSSGFDDSGAGVANEENRSLYNLSFDLSNPSALFSGTRVTTSGSGAPFYTLNWWWTGQSSGSNVTPNDNGGGGPSDTMPSLHFSNPIAVYVPATRNLTLFGLFSGGGAVEVPVCLLRFYR